MNKPLSQEDIAAMENQLRNCVEDDRKYWQVNDVKCDAIHTAKTYEEFADRVAAAHLRPLEKSDYKQKVPRTWNQCATNTKNVEE
ncbi:coiled-coil domain-containing protein 103 [Bombyx mandarina]|uniref:Coiled-coil domain-containing protein 103 n=1 Tax=Bombyx mandarina TaxID=7092 RepID=A0A6J2JSU8_BOMMA|nr:coiled-coil domain-containing protein 103 [Bombyx mandarina]XP_028032901.1 coiled-coil domain-containing protein 103 [Bombyx mandarina]